MAQQPAPARNSPDGAGGQFMTMGRHNKWGFVDIVLPGASSPGAGGPGQGTGVNILTLGLVESLSITEDNGTSYDAFAGGNWLELNIGTPMWRGSMARSHVRGADIKTLIFQSYQAALTLVGGGQSGDNSGNNRLNLSMMPLILRYNYNYESPFIDPNQSVELAQWVYHKIVIVSHTQTFVSGANQRLREDMSFIGAGEEYNSNNKHMYSSDPSNFAANFFTTTPGAKGIPGAGTILPSGGLGFQGS